jgi:hypothetical protein
MKMNAIKAAPAASAIAGDVPTKVRKTPRDLAQARIYTTRCDFLRLPKSDCFQAANFGGLIPTESCSFSSEKSYSPSRLICCQDTTEPFATAWNRISGAFAAPRGAVQSRSGAEDAIDNVRGPTPHASRANGVLSVMMIPWRFTYLCWNIPYSRESRGRG